MDNTKSILFLGDSFTWGEGLELYSDFPFWIDERKNNNDCWLILKHKQDEDSINFRNTHRYPYLVAKYYGCKYFMDSENGGTIARNLNVLYDTLINNNITNIVLQFSTYSREPLHLTFNCSCDFCLDSNWAPMLDNLNMYFYKKNDKNNGHNTIETSEQKVFDFISEKIKYDNIYSVEFLDKADEYIQQNYAKQVDFICKNYLAILENNYNISINFIDSWCPTTSNLIKNNYYILNRLIPLIGKNQKKYKNWNDWLSTFENKSISDNFPKTNNGHPTLEMHNYISKSIINHFNKLKNNII